MMKMVRIFWASLCFILFGLGSLLVGSIIFPVCELLIPHKKQRFIFSNVVHYSWKIFVFIMSFFRLISVDIDSKINLKQVRGTVIISNHPSLIDIVILIAYIPNSICIVKGKLVHNFFMKHIVNSIYIVNNDDTVLIMQEAKKAIYDGMNVIIFPEGTRTNFEIKEPKLYRGFAQLALKSNSEILPIVIDTKPHVLGKNQKWYDLGKKTVKYKIKILECIELKNTDKRSDYLISKEIVDCVKVKIFNAF